VERIETDGDTGTTGVEDTKPAGKQNIAAAAAVAAEGSGIAERSTLRETELVGGEGSNGGPNRKGRLARKEGLGR